MSTQVTRATKRECPSCGLKFWPKDFSSHNEDGWCNFCQENENRSAVMGMESFLTRVEQHSCENSTDCVLCVTLAEVADRVFAIQKESRIVIGAQVTRKCLVGSVIGTAGQGKLYVERTIGDGTVITEENADALCRVIL